MTSPQDPAPSKRLSRSGDDRKLAGVAGGVARHFELDPSLVRIAFVVLALFGGLGLALYGLVALIVPADEGAPPLSGWLKAGLVVVVIIACVSFPFLGGPSLGLLVLFAIGVLVYRSFGGSVDPRLMRASMILVVTAAAFVAGIGAAAAAAFGAGTAMAVLVIALGVGLVVAGLRGGGRWLIAPALLLALPVSVVSAADLDLKGGVGEREYRPTSVTDVRDSYRLGVGELRLDLRDVDFSDVRTLAVDARVGLGRVEVTVPEGVCVRATADVGAGHTDLLGRINDGVDVDAERLETARPGTPTIAVDLHAGAGELVVRGVGGGCE